MLPFLLLPALVATAPLPGIPDAVQVHPRIWVLKGAPGPATFTALKPAHITHVFNLRRDGEPGFDMEGENAAVAAAGASYVRLALSRTPTASDLDLFRTILRGLPSDARVLVHCGNGNRAAAAVCSFLVLDEKQDTAQSLATAREAGLSAPETEKALQAYLARPKG